LSTPAVFGTFCCQKVQTFSLKDFSPNRPNQFFYFFPFMQAAFQIIKKPRFLGLG
jgi:hypothetical protein